MDYLARPAALRVERQPVKTGIPAKPAESSVQPEKPKSPSNGLCGSVQSASEQIKSQAKTPEQGEGSGGDVPETANQPIINRLSSGKAQIDTAIDEIAEKYGLSSDLIHRIIQVESNYEIKAVSPAGAQGLMQLMPGTAKEMGVTRPFDIRQNIEGGTRYLKQMLEMFNGNLKKALAAYNAGPGTVKRHNGNVPYAETRSYVKRIMDRNRGTT